MKKRDTVILILVILLLALFAAFGLFLYKIEYARTAVGTYEDANRQLLIYEIGEPGFPFGNSHCRLVLKQDGREVDRIDFSVANDGKRMSAQDFEVSWLTEGVSVIVHGEEQEDRTYVLYSASQRMRVLPQSQILHANFIEWVKDGFRAVVCDPMENTIFPNGAELTVSFTEGTYFIDLDGTVVSYPGHSLFGKSVSRKLKWVEGMVIEIEIVAYEDYVQDNGFRNRAAGGRIENVDVIAIDVD